MMGGRVLVAMKGHPGCGKSTLAIALATSLRCPLIDKDDILDCLSLLRTHASASASASASAAASDFASASASAFDSASASASALPSASAPPSASVSAAASASASVPASASAFASALNAVSYDVMWNVVQAQLRAGLSVIVDCPLARPHLFQTALSISHQHGARLVIVECRSTNSSEWKRRLETRAAAASASDQAYDLSSTLIQPQNGHHSPYSQESGNENQYRSTLQTERCGKKFAVANYWHKPSKWEDVQKIILDYDGCFNYDTGSVQKLIVDTTSLTTEAVVASVLEWLTSLDSSIQTVFSLQ